MPFEIQVGSRLFSEQRVRNQMKSLKKWLLTVITFYLSTSINYSVRTGILRKFRKDNANIRWMLREAKEYNLYPVISYRTNLL